MFFTLSAVKEENYSYYYKLGNLILNTDSGWKEKTQDNINVIYKGYCDDINLDDEIFNINDSYTGNFSAFYHDKNTGNISFVSDKWRSFNIWLEPGKFVSNLQKTSYPIWTDTCFEVTQLFEFTPTTVDLVGNFNFDKSYADTKDYIYNKLFNKIKNFLSHNKLPIKTFISGGADSTLVYSFVSKLTNNHKTVFANTIEWDKFWCYNSKYIQTNFWGYKQIHHWNTDCVLTSGAPGDEFFLRNPKMLDIWLTYHNCNIADFFDHTARYSQIPYFKKHFKKFTKDNSHQLYKEKLLSLDKIDFFKKLCNNVLNDAQHWHLGKTLTFTPLRDLDIFKSILVLSPEQLKDHIVGADLHISMITKNNPEIVDYLSDNKNVEETYKNIYKLMSKIDTNSGQ